MMPTLNANGFTMYYEQDGAGAPLVYVHGGNTSLLHALHYGRRPFSWRWRQDFVDRSHFLWYERRGCYRSSTPDGGYDLESQANDLLMLLDHLGIEHTHVIGMSAGGPISVVFAALHPKRVRSLTLVSTGLDLWQCTDPKTALVRAQLATLQRAGAEAAFNQRPADVVVSLDALWEREETALLGTLDAWNEQQQILAREAAMISRAERVRRYAAELLDITAGMGVDLRSYTSRVVARSIVIHGSNDRIIPVESARALAASIPGAAWRFVAGEGHQMLFTNPDVRHTAIRFAVQT